MIILDTNVLSELMRRSPDRRVVAWLDNQPRTSIWISSVTLLEIHFGLRILPIGKRRSLLIESFEKLLVESLGRRIAPFDAHAAKLAAELMASRQKKGCLVEMRESMIAGIVLAHHAALATRNTKHFEELTVPVFNPWTS